MKILITGATGFIGQHLLEELKSDEVSIRIISRKQSHSLWCANKNFETFTGDLSDKSSLEPAFREVDIVINLAAELREPGRYHETNIQGVENLIELSEKNKVKKIIHLSSTGVVGMQYSRKKVVINAQSPCHPQNEYERTKLQSELLLRTQNTTDVVILRPTNVFGENHPRKYLLEFLQRVKSGVAIPRTRESTVNYVYVKDVAHAIRHTLLHKTDAPIITIGETMLFRDFLKVIERHMSVACQTRYIPTLPVAFMEAFNYLGIEKIKTSLQAISNCVAYDDSYMKTRILYKYGIEQGIQRTIANYGI